MQMYVNNYFYIENLKIGMNQQENQAGQMISAETQILAQSYDSCPQDLLFDSIVGALQDIVMEPEFSKKQTAFIKQNCMIFEEGEENKNEYMLVFTQYQQQLQTHILQELVAKIPNFCMKTFENLLSTRQDQIDEDLLEMVNSLTDFCTFKNLMMEHKQFYSEGTLKGLSIKGEGFQ